MPEVVYYAGRWYVHVASAFPPVRIPKEEVERWLFKTHQQSEVQ